MRYCTRLSQKKRRRVRVVIPLAYKDEKLALTSQDEINEKKQHSGPQIESGISRYIPLYSEN